MAMSRQVLARREVWAIIGAGVLIPIVFSIPATEVSISKGVQAVYDKVESIPPGGSLLLSFDFDPASKPELEPMGRALARHAFKRGVRVVAMGLWITGTSMAEAIVRESASEFGKVPTRDYTFLGWKPGGYLVIVEMGQDLRKTFPADFNRNPTVGMPVLDGLDSLRDFDYVVSIAAGDPGVEKWVIFGRQKHGFALGGGCTGVIQPGLYPYLQTGQLDGLIPKIRGAAEYELLLRRGHGIPEGLASAGMLSMSFAQLALVGLIVLGNVLHWRSGKGTGR
ncbi:MAG: hypothetical protein HY722_10310 [Planctomycetes bacterium]|nr:hypothetical protein [Planctomycetota bacterium]